MRLSSRTTICLAAALAALAGCGDAPTTDSRQWYTKAPLEDPGLIITPEEPSAMAELGEPDLLGTRAVEDAEGTGDEPTAEDGADEPAGVDGIEEPSAAAGDSAVVEDADDQG